MTAVDFRILGCLEVSEGPRLIDIRASKLRRLLAALLIRVNEAVPAEMLVDVLWGPHPPASWGNSLQAYVSQLRKAVGASMIETRTPGYVLAADADRIDARRFEKLVTEGRVAAAAREPATAIQLLERALSMWRGEALADFRFDAFALPEARRLEELRLVASEELIDAQLETGRHAEIVGRVRALVETSPLRERLWGQLMLALYRCGRQAEALRAFSELRRLLAEELGIEPSPELQRLESDVLLQRPSLDWLPPPPPHERVPGADLPAPRPTPATRYAKSGALHIAYQVTGRGDVDILVVPGWISHLESQWEDPAYRRFMERLGSSARVIRFDKRNMGLSDRTGDSMPPLEDRMDDLRAVMDAAASSRAVLVGVSEGSALSILFAATCPERVAALVLFGGSARLAAGPDYVWGMTQEAAEDLRREVDLHWGTGVTLPLIHPSAVDDPSVVERWSRFERMAASPGAAIATAAMCLQVDVRELLPALRVPTLVLHRRDDALVEAGHGRYLAGHIPGARYVELPGKDHWPWTGDADHVLSELDSFLAATLPQADPDAVLATVLFVEIMTEEAEARGEIRTVLERALMALRGREAASGDARVLLATFDGPARAIRCAATMRDGLRGIGVQARAGLHIGEVHLRDPRPSGVAVEVASAVLRAASPGEVLVSRTVCDVVAGAGIAFQDRGSLEVPNVSGGWKLYRATAV